jgi:hypothetical protein
MPYALPFPNKGRTSAMLYSATDTVSIARHRKSGDRPSTPGISNGYLTHRLQLG